MRDLSEHMLDVFMNSVAAGATLIRAGINDRADGFLNLRIADNGRGMTRQQASDALSPFVTSRVTRKYGLGLPLLSQLAAQSGGRLVIKSKPGAGTVMDATFSQASLDMPPVGDLKSSALSMIMLLDAQNLVYTHRSAGGALSIDTREIREALGGEPGPLSQVPGLFGWLEEFIADEYANSGVDAGDQYARGLQSRNLGRKNEEKL